MFNVFRVNFIKQFFANKFIRSHTFPDKMSIDFRVLGLRQATPKEFDYALDIAVEMLDQGAVIAVPTDTVYGLAVDSTSSEAISALYEVKKRDPEKPLAICVNTIDEIKKWGVISGLPKGLLEKLLPGPVTIVLDRTSHLNANLNAGITKVGIRIPNQPFIRRITEKLNRPLALTSANLSNEPSCINVGEFENLWPLIAAVFDTGDINNKSKEGSTVVDLSLKGKYSIIRPGVGLKSIVQVLHQFDLKE
uniref:Threonylcarbamoyl-AMP synthase n=1 Tax=Clastoptera arizonana TaxID=38151 RepID=A0A1B6D014_9HEMI